MGCGHTEMYSMSFFNKCLLGRLLIPRAMRVDKRALALGGYSIKNLQVVR